MENQKLININGLEHLREECNKTNRTIVFTNGCFDILHAGHVSYLEQARSLGDLLVLGLNSDESIKQLKGKNRPIVPEVERAKVLAGLESISYICIFEEDTPIELIKALKPDILVKGGDWKAEDIVGSDIVLKKGGEVKSLSFIQGASTTNIIGKIVSIYCENEENS